MKKIDFFKTGIVILLLAMIYLMFKLSKTVEANAAENAKTGRFVNMGDGMLLDTKTGATYDVTNQGRFIVQTPEIVK